MLALEESCYGRAWHFPVGRPVTVDEIIVMINQITKSNYQVAYMPSWLLGILQLFVPIIKEAKQMLICPINLTFLMTECLEPNSQILRRRIIKRVLKR
jgi:hypothetical protein